MTVSQLFTEVAKEVGLDLTKEVVLFANSNISNPNKELPDELIDTVRPLLLEQAKEILEKHRKDPTWAAREFKAISAKN